MKQNIYIFHKVLMYGICVFFLVMLVLTCRSASLIWIHDVYSIRTNNPWVSFRFDLSCHLLTAVIQTVIMFAGAVICSLRHGVFPLKYMAYATVLLCTLDLFLRPIGIWFNRGVSLISLFIFPLISLLFLYIILTICKSKGSYQSKIDVDSE